MAWYDEAIFYHIYPLGLTGAPKENAYGEPVHRLREIFPWIDHVKEIGCTAIYIGPLFESVGHGYETTDYKKLDSRLGDNRDLQEFVTLCHEKGIRVILDGVFNHTGRDFFAFRDIREKREQSPYRDWYRNVNFYGNNEFGDGFSYDNWGGYNIMAKLNQQNPAVRDYICDVIRFWVSEFDIDGIRLDAADVLDFEFMKALRNTANQVKPEFWLMGEVIHGDYTRWVNEGTLHSVTNYHLHKALYSGHNDHNYFEIAHTVKRLYGMGGNRPDGLKLYNFADNHDVERIYTKLTDKGHFTPVHILLYTLPGVPSVYYGSEFGIEGKKEWGSDASLRPALSLEDFRDALSQNPCTRLVAALGRIRQAFPALSYGGYREIQLTNRQYVFARETGEMGVYVAVNNDGCEAHLRIPVSEGAYVGLLSGQSITARDGAIEVTIGADGGEIFVPEWAQKDLLLHAETVSGKTVEDAASAERKNDEKANAGKKAAVAVKNKNAEKVKADKEAAEKAERERAEKEAAEKAERERAEKEAAEKAERERAEKEAAEKEAAEKRENRVVVPTDKSYEEMTVEELQQVVLDKMAKNGPITEEMLRTVRENIYHNSLVNWAKSFR